MKTTRFIPVCVGLAISLASVCAAFAEKADEAQAEFDAFREQVASAFPDVEWTEMEEPVSAVVSPPVFESDAIASIPTVAIFVRNQTRRTDLDEEIDALRSALAAELSMYDLSVIDSTDLMDRFRQNRLPGDPELRELVSGLSPGGTAVRVAGLVDADYLVLLNITSADVRQNVSTGVAIDTFTMRFAVRVLDGVRGGSIFGETFERRHPRRGGATGDAGIYFRDLMSRAIPDVAQAVADSQPSWPVVERPVELVSFTVRTNLDHFVDGLEHGVRGPVDLLDEVRRLVGGTTVLLNGVAIGSTPGTFQVPPGLHNLRIEREWMAPYEVTVQVREGTVLNVALELSDLGLQRFASLEGVRAALAMQYARAAVTRGIRINYDTAAWQNVAVGQFRDRDINVNILDR